MRKNWQFFTRYHMHPHCIEGLWHWRQTDQRGVSSESPKGFLTLNACRANAQECGLEAHDATTTYVSSVLGVIPKNVDTIDSARQ